MCNCAECNQTIERLRAEVARQTDMACQADWALGRVSAAIGDNRYLDPPDGGSVTLAEQVERMRADRDRLRAALDRVLPWIDARRLTPEDDAVADAVRAALAGSAPAPATTTTYTVPGPYAPIQTSGYSQPDWPTMRPVAPASAPLTPFGEALRLLARVGRDLIAMGTCDDEITAFLVQHGAAVQPAAALIDCPDCDGSGVWLDRRGESLDCAMCKGTRKIQA